MQTQINQITQKDLLSQFKTSNAPPITETLTMFGNKLDSIDTVNGSFHVFAMTLSKNFNINFFEVNSLMRGKAEMIYKEALNRLWSKKYFFEHLKKFLSKQKYPNFTFADFFEIEQPKLRTHAEYLKILNEKGEAANIGRVIFKYNGYYLWAYDYELSPEQIAFLKQNSLN